MVVQSVLLGLSVVAAYLTVRASARAQSEAKLARIEQDERARLRDRERRQEALAASVVELVENHNQLLSPSSGGDAMLRTTVVRMRLRAALAAVGTTQYPARWLLEDGHGSLLEHAEDALAAIERDLNALAAASLLPPPSMYFEPRKKRPRHWWPIRVRVLRGAPVEHRDGVGNP